MNTIFFVNGFCVRKRKDHFLNFVERIINGFFFVKKFLRHLIIELFFLLMFENEDAYPFDVLLITWKYFQISTT